jgi:hypothetical protein
MAVWAGQYGAEEGWKEKQTGLGRKMFDGRRHIG